MEDSSFLARAPTVTHRGTSVRIMSHIVSRNTDLVQTSVAAFITKRADLLRYCVRRGRGSLLLWSAAVEGTVGRRGCKAGVASGCEMRAMLDDVDFAEYPFYELR